MCYDLRVGVRRTGNKEFRGKIKVLGTKQDRSARPALTALALIACLMLATPALAQTTTPTTNTPNVPDVISTVLGNTAANPAQTLSEMTGIQLGTATNIVNGVLGNTMTPQAANNLISGIVGGQISNLVGAQLSQIPGLGNLNVNQIVQSGIGGILQNLASGTPAAGLLQQAGSILQIAGNGNIQGIIGQLQQGATQAAINAAAQLINSAFPQLGQLLGGLQGITSTLTGLLQGGLTIGVGGGGNNPDPGEATCSCESDIAQHHARIRSHMTSKRREHEIWFVTEFFTKHVAKALALMAEQLTVAGMQQVQIIGSFFDAKHQLETQRLFQQMTAEAHKDYQPSEGLCTFGTSVRSLAASERAGELAHAAIAARGMQRQLRSGEGLAGSQAGSSPKSGPILNEDRASRIKTFIERFCDQQDNNKTLDEFCKGSKATATTKNRDIDYTRTIENKLTLDLDFHTQGNENPSDDEAALFALGANLYGHDVIPYINAWTLTGFKNGRPMSGELHLMDARALNAKRSVAQNSFAAITGMKASGTAEAQPYLYKMVAELGVPEEDLETLLGKNPSYFAQMEILTKKALQNPVFYTELYDKPANVDRKGAVLQAVGLMQDRDIYKSLLRSEAILSVLLETMLEEDHNRVAAQIETMNKREQGKASTGGSQ